MAAAASYLQIVSSRRREQGQSRFGAKIDGLTILDLCSVIAKQPLARGAPYCRHDASSGLPPLSSGSGTID